MIHHPRFPMHSAKSSLCAGLLFASLLSAPRAFAQQSTAFDQIVDRAIARENALLGVLRSSTPVAETYIQDLVPDTDFGAAPRADHYFLGRIDLSKGIAQTSYLPKTGSRLPVVDLFRHFFTIEYLPRGFAQMMLIDGAQFDRAHYEFEFVRREFLGDVRTLVVSVNPRREAGRGRFKGEIWIEDRAFNIVRFNGTYSGTSAGRMYLHFDSWRWNAGPDLWLPYEVYCEESQLSDFLKIHTQRFKALTRFWAYGGPEERMKSEFTNLIVQTGHVEDKSPAAADTSPVESLRAWEKQSEDNILERLELAGLIAKRGGLDKVLDTVVNNIAATNDLNLVPEVRTRALLTTPVESFTVGRTIVISRGLVDTLPDEASLAAVLAHELAHIIVGHGIATDFAFSDRGRFDDSRIVDRFRLARTPAEEDAANEKAFQLLLNSPYKDKLSQAGLFLKALGKESDRLPALIKPLFGAKMVEGHNVLRMAALMEKAPELQTTRLDQIAALPLGSHTRLDPWSDDLEMALTRSVPVASPREKMPFELTPIYLHLTYEESRRKQAAEQ